MFMKSIHVLIVSALLLLVSCSAGDSWVRVEGNKFVDPQGKEIVFRGLCFSDPVKLVRDGQWNERYFAEAAAWGSNVVRFAVHPANLNSMGWEGHLLYGMVLRHPLGPHARLGLGFYSHHPGRFLQGLSAVRREGRIQIKNQH